MHAARMALPPSVTIRLRMSSHDAHYAGELVDGARMLGLFGDVATELLARLDGDEGLFRAYSSVEFLAPVHAGDYVEATGTVVRVGATSREMDFVATKVLENVREPGVAASQVRVVEPPVVVCRARGTCVTPKALQRLPSQSMREVILTAAIVGAEVTRAQTPHLPISAEEIAAEAARCVEAGASVIHLHVRKPDGTPSQDGELFRAALRAISRKVDVVVQTSTGGAVGMSLDERAACLAVRPEMATLNVGTMNFGDEVFVNARPEVREMARRIRAAGAVPELEIYDAGHLEAVRTLHAEGLVAPPFHVQFVLGVPGGISADEASLRFLVSRLPEDSTWGVAAVGRHQRPMTELAMRLGGHARVGLEDNLFLEKGVLSEGSSPLVARAAAYARSIGREPVTPAGARALLGLAGHAG